MEDNIVHTMVYILKDYLNYFPPLRLIAEAGDKWDNR